MHLTLSLAHGCTAWYGVITRFLHKATTSLTDVLEAFVIAPPPGRSASLVVEIKPFFLFVRRCYCFSHRTQQHPPQIILLALWISLAFGGQCWSCYFVLRTHCLARFTKFCTSMYTRDAVVIVTATSHDDTLSFSSTRILKCIVCTSGGLKSCLPALMTVSLFICRTFIHDVYWMSLRHWTIHDKILDVQFLYLCKLQHSQQLVKKNCEIWNEKRNEENTVVRKLCVCFKASLACCLYLFILHSLAVRSKACIFLKQIFQIKTYRQLLFQYFY